MELLHYKEFGESGQPIVILHGLFGSSDNWQTLARKMSEENHKVYIVDQRNHGHSFHASDDFNYNVMASDLNNLLNTLDLNDVILLGHSMGGKTVMQYSMTYGDARVDKLIVADIGPKQYPLHHDLILKALTTTDFKTHNSRKLVDAHLSKFIDQMGVRQFLLKNLYWKEKGKLAWRFNVEVLNRDIEAIVAKLDNDEVTVPTLFIRGANSNYILDSDVEGIFEQFPMAKLDAIEGVGHWLHAEAPTVFLEKVNMFING